MKTFLRKVGLCIPYVRKYLKLDAIEKDLYPKVREEVRRIVREGTDEEKKYITDKIRTELKKCKVELPA